MQKVLETIRSHEMAIRELRVLDKQKKLAQRGRALLEFHQTESARSKEAALPFFDYLRTESAKEVGGYLEKAIVNYYFNAADSWDIATITLSQHGLSDTISKTVRRVCANYDRS